MTTTKPNVTQMEIMSNGSFSALVLCDDVYYITLSEHDQHKKEYFEDIERGILNYPWCPVVKKVDRYDIIQFVNDKAPNLDMIGCAESVYEIEFLRNYPDDLSILKSVACTINGKCGTRWYNKEFDDCIHELTVLCHKYDNLVLCTGAIDIPSALDFHKIKVNPHTKLDDVNRIRNVMWRGNQFVIVDPFYTVEY